MIRTSEEIVELSEALVKAQSQFSSAIKDSTNPAFRSKYADLTSVIAAMVPHLNKEGLAVMQHPALEFQERGEERIALVTVTTRLQHKSGQWMESDLSVPAVMRERFDAQSVGSAITYACRYGLQSIGVLGREDDDGNSAAGAGSREAAQAVAQAKLEAYKKTGKMPVSEPNSEERPSGERSLFWVWHEESQTATIHGDEALKKLNKDILRNFWQPNVKQIVVNADQLEELKYSFEQRKIPFSALKEA
jgi:hypothetical protein